MNHLIKQAIIERRLLSFSYKGSHRLVEPHTYGQRPDGRDALCAWQRTGGSGSDFRLFFVGEASNLAVEKEIFASPREDYQRGDSRFLHIYAEL
jgi:hypothetical protein